LQVFFAKIFKNIRSPAFIGLFFPAGAFHLKNKKPGYSPIDNPADPGEIFSPEFFDLILGFISGSR
jgi:hypothetical protein